MPRYGRTTRPLSESCSTICLAVSMGMAKLTPSAASAFMAVIPMTSPSRLTSGPPLLPWLIGASVWMYSGQAPARPRSTAFRSTQEMMPWVTLFCRCSGLPSETTHSPTRSPMLLPSLTTGSGSRLRTCSTAMSLTRSKLATSPSRMRPSCSVTVMPVAGCRPLLSRITWALVRMTPPASMMKPDPEDFPPYTPKLRLGGATLWLTVMLTTAGKAFAAASAMKCRPRAPAAVSVADSSCATRERLAVPTEAAAAAAPSRPPTASCS
mmetsp:Transcript_34234/g.86241  ORF Transcript_34234/g.86241 Transcript_34234/m.86241 type:complete len:266 (+) Transcript_34234:427-1224(+)